MKQSNQYGFTLIELLIAMLVFSVLSVMAYSGLQSVLDVKNHTEKQAEKLVNLQTAFTFISRDIEQIISRGVRDSFGDSTPAVSGGGFGSTIMEMTRTGVSNPTGMRRSNLQRVAYNLKDKQLARWTWPVLDQGVVMEPLERILVSGISDRQLRFLGKDSAWSDTWPISRDPKDRDVLPLAIELTLKVEDVGEIKRIFRVPAGLDVIKTPPASPSGTGGI